MKQQDFDAQIIKKKISETIAKKEANTKRGEQAQAMKLDFAERKKLLMMYEKITTHEYTL